MKEKEKYLDWITYFMTVAKVSSLRSKDPNSKVGAVIVNNLNQIVATGYNGFPRGVNDDDFPWNRDGDFLESKYAYVAHAELNAIVSARRDLTGFDLYVTLFPCNECAKIVIQAGIKKIYYLEDKYEKSESIQASKKMLTAAKIDFIQTPKYDFKINVEVKD